MKKAIFLPIFIFLIFAMILYGLVPPLARARFLAGEVAKQAAALQETKDYFANLQAVAEQLDQNPDILANVAEALPVELSLPSLMSFFQITSAESGLLLRDFNYSETAGETAPGGGVSSGALIDNFVKTTSFNLTLNGSISSFENFLKNLEMSSKILDVGQISFQAPSGIEESVGQNDNKKNDIDFIISVKTYSY